MLHFRPLVNMLTIFSMGFDTNMQVCNFYVPQGTFYFLIKLAFFKMLAY